MVANEPTIAPTIIGILERLLDLDRLEMVLAVAAADIEMLPGTDEEVG